MFKEFMLHIAVFVLFFLLLSVVRFMGLTDTALYTSLGLLWLGGVVGTILPDIDHLIYVYFLRPHELTSQRTSSLAKEGHLTQAGGLLVATQNERQNMIFHTIWFQVIFLLFTVWVLTSSSNFFGWGVVLGFSLHLLVDQAQDYKKYKSLNNWFADNKLNITGNGQLLYLLGVAGLIVFFAFFS
jgi:hypothetical protein